MPAAPFSLSRTLAAPRARVWSAFTEADQLQAWFGPRGMTMTEARLDFGVGGQFLYQLQAANGLEFWGKWTFLEIVPEAKLHVISAFSDADGGLGSHPLAPEWPQQMLATFVFQNAGLAETTLTLTSSAYQAPAAATAIFDAGHASLQMGWSGTFAQLDAHLARN
jgi:uncharacterized protein YndB with AHSA1/START domain